MKIGPEEERPYHLKVYRDAKTREIKQKKVPFTDSEWQHKIEKSKKLEERKKELTKTQYLRDREEAYKQEIYPHLDNAKMLAELEGDRTKLDELKAKKQEIDNQYPKQGE